MKLATASLLLATLPGFLDSTVQAGLLPRLRPRGNHLAHIRRQDSPAWTSKQDSTLLQPDPSEDQVAQAREQNDQMAKQAYPNLLRVSGGKAQNGGSDATSTTTTTNNNKRAAFPQGSFAAKPVHLKAGEGGGGTGGDKSTDSSNHDKAAAYRQRNYMQSNKEMTSTEQGGNGKQREKRDNKPQFQYGKEPVRGVNIGGWLVLEPWITPSIFTDTGDDAVVDEYTYGAKYGPEGAAARLKKHWDTWVTEEDFKTIAAYGLNHVRIPIGYWALDTSKGEPYPQGQYPYLLKAVQWASKYDLKVMIDIHGAPGSQNGFDNSGRRGSVNWHNDEENVKRTRDVLQTIVNTFAISAYADTVTAIELLNEPAGFVGQKMVDTVKQYYYDGYGEVRYPESTTSSSDTVVVMHDAFQPLSTWKGFMPSPSWKRVMLDTHYYSIFNENDLRMTDEQRIQAVCKSKAGLVDSNQDIWTVVGEWTPANTDCAAKLNGAGVGSRYDGTYPGSTAIGSCTGKTGNADTFSEELKETLAKYWEVQANVFESASGWIQWAWKTESADEWSYKKGVEYGWIPKDPSVRVHGDLCAAQIS